MPRKNKYIPSIMQTGEPECYLCHKKNPPFELHHAISGNGNRAICTELGLWIWLCPKCHRDLHEKNIGYKEVQADAQKSFIKNQRKKGFTEEVAREIWYERFKKFYEG